MRRTAISACRDLLAMAALVAAAPAGAQETRYTSATLQGLDKTTARVSTIEAPIDYIANFGTLQIVARACRKKPPTEPPESAAFLEIVDVRPDSAAVSVFTGWMFASSPAVSAMEHPVYDIWVIDCGTAPPPEEDVPAAMDEGMEAEASEPGAAEPAAE